MATGVKTVPQTNSEREALRRKLLELILKNEARRRLTLGKRSGE
jgi:DNA-binding TFAR19-related protein (PDSD5 family)